MKRILAFLLALAVALPLAACGGVIPLSNPPAPENGGRSGSEKPAALTAAVYPETPGYPDEELWDAAKMDAWSKAARDRRAIEVRDLRGLDGFLTASLREFLGKSGGENRVFSPLNVYMALAMLAELTDGESRAQILSLLGSDSVAALREQAGALWNKNYRNDGATTSILAASLWLNQDVRFVQKTLDLLAQAYYASAYQGRMGTAETDKALQDWIDEQTGGLLHEQASGLHLDAQTVLALATTIYFKARWTDEFNKNATAPGLFHGASGDKQVDFLHQSHTNTYYWGESFSAVGQGLQSDGAMWFLLPDEGVTPEALLSDDEAMAFLLGAKYDWADQKYLVVNLSVPKFDVSSDLGLVEGLRSLGVTDVFDADRSDFSPMTQDADGVYVSQAQHAARVKIDEEGVEAAAYTVMMMAGAAMPPKDEVDFTLDRPFLFVVTGADSLPLFVGIVNSCG